VVPSESSRGQAAAPPEPARRSKAQLTLLTAAGLLPCLAACASGPALPECDLGATASANPDGYQLGVGDQLRVTVFRHEPLSGEFTVGAGGMVALPLVGAVFADGLTARELEIAIEDQLREQDYLLDPDVSIQLLTHRPFYVVGEVAEPGVYEYVAGMTLANAVALAGGYTYRADRSSVAIVHGDCVRDVTAVASVLPGDIVRVPERFF
jgi:polysaccharide export outer membrane protein